MTREHGKRFDRTTDRQAATDTAKAMFADVWHDTGAQRERIKADLAKAPQTQRIGNVTIPVRPKKANAGEPFEQRAERVVNQLNDAQKEWLTNRLLGIEETPAEDEAQDDLSAYGLEDEDDAPFPGGQ